MLDSLAFKPLIYLIETTALLSGGKIVTKYVTSKKYMLLA